MSDEGTLDVGKIVDEVKNQGLFDQLRRDCLADVETQPAYRRLKRDVDGYCARFLDEQKWHPGLNKIELRDRLRERLLRTDFVTYGVKSIVERLVGYEKMQRVLYDPVERIVYDMLGLSCPSDDKITSDTAHHPRDNSSPEPESKRSRLDNKDQQDDANDAPSTSRVSHEGRTRETPVQDELCQPPVDPTPPEPPHNQSDSSGELSLRWHVTQLSPNPNNDQEDCAPGPSGKETVGRVTDLQYDENEDVESPAHERL